MLKQLVIPFFVLSIAAVGCGSSSSGTPDGSAGHVGTAGTTGTAGTGADAAAGTTGGTAGSAAGAVGTAGTGADAAAGTVGTAGTGADAAAGTGVDASTDTVVDTGADTGSNLTAAEAMCPVKRAAAMNAVAYSAADFCAVYMDICGTTAFTGSLTAGDCQTMYTAWAGKNVAGGTTSVQSCVSYHLCNAQTMEKAVHCPHAAGMGPCAQ